MRAKNAIWPTIIFSLAYTVAELFRQMYGVAEPSFAIQAFVWLVQLLGMAAVVVYLMGFWAMGKRYNERAVQRGAGTLIVVIIVGLVIGSTLSFFMQNQDTQSPSTVVAISQIAYLIFIVVVMGLGYLFLGKGLKRLASELGPRSRTIGNLFFASGICTFTVIGIIGALVLWIIAYCMSFKLFAEELARAAA